MTATVGGDPDRERGDGQKKKHDGNGNDHIENSFGKAMMRTLERFIAQADKLQASIFDERDLVAEEMLEIAGYEEAHAEALTHIDDVVEVVFDLWNLREDNLGGRSRRIRSCRRERSEIEKSGLMNNLLPKLSWDSRQPVRARAESGLPRRIVLSRRFL